MRLKLNDEDLQKEAGAIDAIEQTRKDQREFQRTLLGELMGCSQQKKIARIKIVREHTGLDLRRAKMVVDAINDEIPFLDMAQHGRDQETLQRLGDENSRLRRQCGESEDKLGKSQSELRLAISTRDAISDRYGKTQEILEKIRSVINILSDETDDGGLILRGLMMTLAGLVDSASDV